MARKAPHEVRPFGPVTSPPRLIRARSLTVWRFKIAPLARSVDLDRVTAGGPTRVVVDAIGRAAGRHIQQMKQGARGLILCGSTITLTAARHQCSGFIANFPIPAPAGAIDQPHFQHWGLPHDRGPMLR
jgi:hypothetical protein